MHLWSLKLQRSYLQKLLFGVHRQSEQTLVDDESVSNQMPNEYCVDILNDDIINLFLSNDATLLFMIRGYYMPAVLNLKISHRNNNLSPTRNVPNHYIAYR